MLQMQKNELKYIQTNQHYFKRSQCKKQRLGKTISYNVPSIGEGADFRATLNLFQRGQSLMEVNVNQ